MQTGTLSSVKKIDTGMAFLKAIESIVLIKDAPNTTGERNLIHSIKWQYKLFQNYDSLIESYFLQMQTPCKGSLYMQYIPIRKFKYRYPTFLLLSWNSCNKQNLFFSIL